MAYDHKKSLRTLTDEQFSDGTTVDGSRIDKALGDATDHFNNIPGGDVSTRFTRANFIFGYQPSCYRNTTKVVAGPPVTRELDTGPGAPGIGTNTEGPTWPWTFIKNSIFTVFDGAIAGVPTLPTGGQQNEWRLKGSSIDKWPDTYAQPLENEGLWEEPLWRDWWLNVPAAVATAREVSSGYQFTWSHSWQFNNPVIVDSLCVLLRTDEPTGGATSGFYDAPFAFALSGGATVPNNSIVIQASVDNTFASEERSMNDMDINVSGRFMDSYKVTELGSPAVAYTDMLPNAPDFNAGVGNGVMGRLIRFRDLNIPVRQYGRLRLSITIPWFPDLAPAPATSSCQGLNTGSISTKLPFGNPTQSRGLETMYGFSVNGTLGVLEEVES